MMCLFYGTVKLGPQGFGMEKNENVSFADAFVLLDYGSAIRFNGFEILEVKVI